MARPSPWLLLCLLCSLVACAGRNQTKPAYKTVAELDKCFPGECVEAELRFQHWADAEHYRGRMPYHCDPGSEIDGDPDPNITRLIIAVHGVVGSTPESLARRTIPPGLEQFRYVVAALRRAESLDPELDPSTIAIIAPTFQRTESWQPYTDEDPRIWTWTASTYNLGTLAKQREAMSGLVKAESVSSFDVLDEFLRGALVKFPNIQDIVLVGHSSGGQFIHRYVWMGVGVHEQLTAAGIRIRYMPANPGAYAFPIWERKQSGRESPWVTPRKCEDWDEWGYGLAHLADAPGDRPMRAANYAIDTYLRPVDRQLARRAMREPGGQTWGLAARRALILMYATREVWHIQAATDREATYTSSCRTALQGRSRYERFSNFQEAWVTRLGLASNLHFVALENASHPHSSKVVYSSDPGIHLLFH